MTTPGRRGSPGKPIEHALTIYNWEVLRTSGLPKKEIIRRLGIIEGLDDETIKKRVTRWKQAKKRLEESGIDVSVINGRVDFAIRSGLFRAFNRLNAGLFDSAEKILGKSILVSIIADTVADHSRQREAYSVTIFHPTKPHRA